MTAIRTAIIVACIWALTSCASVSTSHRDATLVHVFAAHQGELFAKPFPMALRGSGVYDFKHRIVITNQHVVPNEEDFAVWFPSGTTCRVKKLPRIDDPLLDIRYLMLDEGCQVPDWPVWSLGSFRPIEISTATLYGYHGYEKVELAARYQPLSSPIKGCGYCFAMRYSPPRKLNGTSGGAIVSADGVTIEGIMAQVQDYDDPAWIFAISIDEALRHIPEVLAKERLHIEHDRLRL